MQRQRLSCVIAALIILLSSFNLGSTTHLENAEAEIEVKDISTQLIGDNFNKIKKTTSEIKQKIKKESKEKEIKWVEFTLTHYSSLAEENSKYGGVNCKGEPLQPYMVASNYYPLGTEIYLEGYGEKIVADRGGKSFNSPKRLDVYIPRNKGETDKDYYNRIQKMGVKKVRGYLKE